MASIKELYLSGLSQREIAKQIGISQSKVGRILKSEKCLQRKTKTDSKLEQEIFNKYIDKNINSEMLSKQYNLSSTTICRIIKRLGGKIRLPEINKRQYNIIEDYFEKIDSEEKAYILGFLYADGNVNKRTNTIKIEIHKKDIDILYKIKKCIFIDKGPEISDDRGYKYITINCKKVKSDLIKLGCVPNKTFQIRMPKIKKYLLRHFLRGVYDGDGCINFCKGRVRVILTGNKLFIGDIGKLLYKYNIYPAGSYDGSLEVVSKESSLKLLQWLYKGSFIYLARKYTLYQKAIVRLSTRA